MTETATVMRIEGKRVTVGCSPSASCGMCARRRGDAFCNLSSGSYLAINRGDLALSLGDTVEVYVPSGRTVASGVLVLIVPLVLFVLFFVGAGALVRHLAEGLRALAGLGGLGLGLAGGLLLARSGLDGQEPEIVASLPGPTASGAKP